MTADPSEDDDRTPLPILMPWISRGPEPDCPDEPHSHALPEDDDDALLNFVRTTEALWELSADFARRVGNLAVLIQAAASRATALAALARARSDDSAIRCLASNATARLESLMPHAVELTEWLAPHWGLHDPGLDFPPVVANRPPLVDEVWDHLVHHLCVQSICEGHDIDL